MVARPGSGFKSFARRADEEAMTDISESPVTDPGIAAARDGVDAKRLERKGRRWLLWSFVFCPCHLPLTMAVLASIFGGTAFGTLIDRNTLGTGLVFGAIYATGVAIGFRHLRRATAAIDCSDGSCTLP